MKRVLLWGCGADYNRNYNLISTYAGTRFEVVGITAREIPDGPMLDNFKLLHLSKLNTIQFDCVIVMSEKYYHEILPEAGRITGLPLEMIFPCRILAIPYFDFDRIVEISESHYSFVSNNCWGGTLCYTLGIECRSPFKNLSIADGDYLRMLGDFHGYMKLDPVFEGETELDTNSGKTVPMLRLDDVRIKCNHYPDPYDAINKWNARKVKINYDNLYLEMYTEDYEMAERFDSIDIGKKKICFVPFETKLKSCIRLKNLPGQKKFWETVNEAVRSDSRGINYSVLSLFEQGLKTRI